MREYATNLQRMMQQINVEFERLHEIWKNDTTVSANASGYENDYAGASAKEYADFVYNEYRWKGRNYQGPVSYTNLRANEKGRNLV